MNYYPHHIGDFDRATRHLTRIERSIYRDLLDVYYDTEAPLTLDHGALCRKIIARSEEETGAVHLVLFEFFVKTPAGWYHARCEEEIEAYRKNNSQKSMAGKASAAARAQKLQDAINGISTGVATAVPTAVELPFDGTPTNQEPITNNHEPVTKNQKPRKSKAAAGSRLPEDWKPSPDDLAYCKTERPDLLPSLVAKNFYDYWISKSGKDATKLRWDLTWQSWVRKESAASAGRHLRPGAAPMQAQLSVADQNAANTEAARQMLFGPKPKTEEMGELDHA